jgi:hypothetical protein
MIQRLRCPHCRIPIRCAESRGPWVTLDISATFVVNRYLGRLPMRLLKRKAAHCEVGDGLMGL